ncbi:Uncharacterised protein [Vibrio cholerae]|uniref:Uncharacterized protein n=1 Tax=Vibrio cholerae TaxID=666 RepID=A0A655Y782_VIBCL|nr:Uncharacterised protein [Vibrio cholerae]CSC69662.1 Uncharacterised protein [Vibrio cholerae]
MPRRLKAHPERISTLRLHCKPLLVILHPQQTAHLSQYALTLLGRHP